VNFGLTIIKNTNMSYSFEKTCEPFEYQTKIRNLLENYKDYNDDHTLRLYVYKTTPCEKYYYSFKKLSNKFLNRIVGIGYKCFIYECDVSLKVLKESLQKNSKIWLVFEDIVKYNNYYTSYTNKGKNIRNAIVIEWYVELFGSHKRIFCGPHYGESIGIFYESDLKTERSPLLIETHYEVLLHKNKITTNKEEMKEKIKKELWKLHPKDTWANAEEIDIIIDEWVNKCFNNT